MTTNYAVMGADDAGAEIFPNVDAAVAYLDSVTPPEERERLQVWRMESLSESVLWDWSTLPAGDDSDPKFTYTSEVAARNCLRDGQVLVKRRRGANAWVTA